MDFLANPIITYLKNLCLHLFLKETQRWFSGVLYSAAFTFLHLTPVLFLEELNLKSLWFSNRRR